MLFFISPSFRKKNLKTTQETDSKMSMLTGDLMMTVKIPLLIQTRNVRKLYYCSLG